MKETINKNVWASAIERIEYIFNNFKHVYISFSGGKDSGVCIQLLNLVAKKMKRTYDVLFIDLEGQYNLTIEFVKEISNLSNINNFYWLCLPIVLRNAVSQFQPRWIPWDFNAKDLWIRELPESINNKTILINENNVNEYFTWFKKGEEFEELIINFSKWYEQDKEQVAVIIAIRADESFHRFCTLTNKKKIRYINKDWSTFIKDSKRTYNFYPIYDWKTRDIWIATFNKNLLWNKVYDLMYKNGLSIHEQRLCQPYGDDQKNGLDQFRYIEPNTWEKLLKRVSGVNFGNIYCRTSLLGNIKTEKPKHFNWEEYTIFLLESLAFYNKELVIHYVEKIDKFMKWYEKNKGILLENIPQELDSKIETNKEMISWRRIARAIERNDWFMKRLSFGQTKNDIEKLYIFIDKYNNFLDINNTSDKHLKQLFKK